MVDAAGEVDRPKTLSGVKMASEAVVGGAVIVARVDLVAARADSVVAPAVDRQWSVC